MKPLELTVYPHVMDGGWDCIEDSEGTLRIDRELDDFAQAKRLTDAELAAEYWRAKWTGLITERSLQRPLPDEYRAMIATVERFMGLPHYDESPDNRRTA